MIFAYFAIIKKTSRYIGFIKTFTSPIKRIKSSGERFIFCLLIFASFNVNSQKVLKENLTKKKTFYWDFQNTKPQSIGSYYKDPLGETALEHGKWEYYDREGKLTEIRNYYAYKG